MLPVKEFAALFMVTMPAETSSDPLPEIAPLEKLVPCVSPAVLSKPKVPPVRRIVLLGESTPLAPPLPSCRTPERMVVLPV